MTAGWKVLGAEVVIVDARGKLLGAIVRTPSMRFAAHAASGRLGHLRHAQRRRRGDHQGIHGRRKRGRRPR